MNVVNLSDQLQQILKIIDRWESADVAYIERDVVLSKLQNVYQQVLFLNTNGASSIETNLDKVEEVHCAITTKEVVTTLHESVVSSSEVESTVVETEQIQNESISEVKENHEATEEEVQREDEAIAEKEIDTNVPENTLAENSTPEANTSVRHLFDRNAIKSLYDDNCTVKSTTVVVETYTEAQTITSVEPTVNSISKIGETPCSIIGDIMLNGVHTIGDEFNRNNNSRDVATSIACGNSLTLKGAIGINDKFLMLKEMFNGDITSYQSTIEMLEEFTDMDDALIFIHDNFDWNPNSAGVKLLIELLNRKLS